jgi:hypothetical protein
MWVKLPQSTQSTKHYAPSNISEKLLETQPINPWSLHLLHAHVDKIGERVGHIAYKNEPDHTTSSLLSTIPEALT